MATFVDNQGREWAVSLDVAAMKRVRAAVGVDLYRALEGGLKGIAELLADGITFGDVLYVLCREQARDRGVTDEQFGAAIAGDAVEAAANAFVQAAVDFCPSQRRTALRAALAIGATVRDLVENETARHLEAARPSPSDSPTGPPASAG